MFSPNNIDEVLVHATHLEASKGKHGFEDVSKDPPKFEKHSKRKGRNMKTTIVKKY